MTILSGKGWTPVLPAWVLGAAALLVLGGWAGAQETPGEVALRGPTELDGTTLADAMRDVSGVFDKDEAMKLLTAIDPYYRVRGNQGYQRSLSRAFLMLEEAGFAEPSDDDAVMDTVQFRDYGALLPAWTPISANLSVVSPDVGTLHSFETEAGEERTFLCVNSFSTPQDGILAPLVRYEPARPVESYAGTIVYGASESSFNLFAKAVQQGGALGVISGRLPDYNDPDSNRDAIHFSKVPYDPEREAFGLNVSRAKRAVLERLLAGGMVYVKVEIHARFTQERSRTLVATIKGTDSHAGTVALVAHLDEPGANDNGSGVAATVAMGTGYLRAIRTGLLPRPRRSISFLLGTEFECSREWLRSISEKVDLSLIIDMVGEGPDNGAIPLVERMPDPGAIWDRPPLDIHSEWGRSDVRQGDLVGSFLNDYVMAAMAARQEVVDWPVRTNPYEGGSDHESFLERGIPSVLLWHFTDPYYHTSLDRLDKVDPDEMENVAIATLTLVHHFAQAGLGRAEEVLNIVMAAARKRLATEAETARVRLSLPAVADDPAQLALVSDRERTILAAWSHWYREAVLSLEGFEPGFGASDARRQLEAHIDQALTELRRLERQAMAGLEG